jgi:hypothetical protein
MVTNVLEEPAASIFYLKMEAVSLPKTLVAIYQITQCHIEKTTV